MRRVLSILLVAVLGLAPLSALVPGNWSAHLPICCRKRGAHHCEMPEDAAARIVAAISGSTATVGAPSRCPQYPGAQSATLTPVFAPAPQHVVPAAPQTAECVPTFATSYSDSSSFSAHAVRGPPASLLV